MRRCETTSRRYNKTPSTVLNSESIVCLPEACVTSFPRLERPRAFLQPKVTTQSRGGSALLYTFDSCSQYTRVRTRKTRSGKKFYTFLGRNGIYYVLLESDGWISSSITFVRNHRGRDETPLARRWRDTRSKWKNTARVRRGPQNVIIFERSNLARFRSILFLYCFLRTSWNCFLFFYVARRHIFESWCWPAADVTTTEQIERNTIINTYVMDVGRTSSFWRLLA